MARSKTVESIQIPTLKSGNARLRIVGTTPLFQNRMAEKAKQVLLVGGRKKTAAERKEIKHHPHEEFRSSAEPMKDGPTALGLRVTAIKAAMCTAALETAGLNKTSAQRLLFMPGDLFPLYGTPQIRLDVVRSADMNRTPDVRSRAYLPIWGAEVDIQFIMPQLSLASVAALLCNAGMLVGVGDFRQEKGKGSFGSFRVLSDTKADNNMWANLVKHHARQAQLAALKDPQPANDETQELLDYFAAELERRS